MTRCIPRQRSAVPRRRSVSRYDEPSYSEPKSLRGTAARRTRIWTAVAIRRLTFAVRRAVATGCKPLSRYGGSSYAYTRRCRNTTTCRRGTAIRRRRMQTVVPLRQLVVRGCRSPSRYGGSSSRYGNTVPQDTVRRRVTPERCLRIQHGIAVRRLVAGGRRVILSGCTSRSRCAGTPAKDTGRRPRIDAPASEAWTQRRDSTAVIPPKRCRVKAKALRELGASLYPLIADSAAKQILLAATSRVTSKPN